ncbi:hypothetical protein ECG_06502 [Echinococcus granulosus]|uniref:Expressed conserved protein n=1 Tax=Echinococcus granulosus TaxID=6210 RepID=U6JCG7_ECHGR|nr:hypothetical protein EGR_01035 [Echinococcus granulosus]EUB63907.1 hypothetical protein EGR_01035 [Echinococcus granulosus]KAH9280827.1 hypothetical protein ECG_06502 [Echinococcus granulosus]CDS19405.1 expressed conserved protein [Echinococcus granulosus]
MDHPEPISKRVPEIPQCRKGFTLEEARGFVDAVMQVFHSLEDMTDLRSMYETGKQLSRLYFDCHQYRVELAEYLTSLEYPAFASKMMKKLNNMGVFKNDNIWFSSFYFYNTTWNFSEIWPDFATALANAGLPNLLNLNIGHQPYLDNLPSKNVYYLVKASLSIIHNIARVPGNVHCFSTDPVKSALTNKFLREEEFLRCISDLCLAYIVNDNDTNLMTQLINGAPPNNSSVLQGLVDHVVTAKASEKRRCHGFQVSELLSAIATLAVNDSIKPDILSVSVNQAGERITITQLAKEAIEAAAQTTPSLMVIREAEEVARLLWNLSLDPRAPNPSSEMNLQVANWLSGLIKEGKISSLPSHVAKALEAVSARLTLPVPASISPGQGIFLISFAPVNRMAAVKIAERLQAAGLPVSTLEAPDSDNALPDSSAVGMSGAYSASTSFSHWRKMIDSASAIVVCASEAYRLSPGCRYEIECVRPGLSSPSNISGGDSSFKQPSRYILPVYLQPKYKPSGWLGDLLAGQVVLDLSGRKDLDVGFENFTLQAQNLYAEVKQTLGSMMANDRKGSLSAIPAGAPSQTNHVDGLISGSLRKISNEYVSCTTSLGRDGSLPKGIAQPKGPFYGPVSGAPSPDAIMRIRKSAVRAEVRSWSTNTVSQWLKFRGLGQILQVTGAFDGLLLSQLAAMRFWAPEYFARSLQTELHLSFIDGLRLIEALDELSPGSGVGEADGFTGPSGEANYDDRADAFSHVSGCDNMSGR